MIGKNIRALRTSHHETQAELAKHLGVSQRTIAAWECNTREPNIAALRAMKLHCECDFNELLKEA